MPRALVVVVLALVLSGPLACSGPEPAPGPSGHAQRQVLLVITNATRQPLSYVYVSPADKQTWGDDVLAFDEILPGEDAVIELTPGTWDVRCVMRDGQEQVLGGIPVPSDGPDVLVELTEAPTQGERD